MKSVRQDVVIGNLRGLHARAAAEVVNLSCSYQSAITIKVNDKSADCNSLIQLLMLAASKGTSVCLEASGEDAEAAIDALTQLIENHFNESC